MGLSPVKTSSNVLDNQAWKHDGKNPGLRSLTIDGASVRARFPYPGDIPSGVVLAKGAGPIGSLYQGTSDEVQTVTVNGAPTGGTFTLTFSGQTTAPIAFNASAATVQAALQALSTIGAGNVTVSLTGNVYTVSFVGTLANIDDPQLTATSSLTGGSSPAVVVATTTAGGTDLADTAVGFLSTGHRVPQVGDLHVSVYEAGPVKVSELPALAGLDAAARVDLKFIRFHD